MDVAVGYINQGEDRKRAALRINYSVDPLDFPGDVAVRFYVEMNLDLLTNIYGNDVWRFVGDAPHKHLGWIANPKDITA